jgi:hypothetical protein
MGSGCQGKNFGGIKATAEAQLSSAPELKEVFLKFH